MIFVQYLSDQRQRLMLDQRLGKNKKIVNILENPSTLREIDAVTAIHLFQTLCLYDVISLLLPGAGDS